MTNGDKIAAFIERYIILENGTPFKVLPWMKDVIDSWYNPTKPNGTRITKIGLLTLARKNGKTYLLAGLTLYHLMADGEPSPSCCSVAVDREQAGQIYKILEWSIKNNNKLSECLICTPSRKEIKYPARNGVYKSLSSDASGKYGHGHSFVVYDELAFHKSDAVYTALENSTDARPNGLQIIISTAGWKKDGVFYRLYQHSKGILNGTIKDPSFVPHVYETKEGSNLDDENTWRQANPSLGVTLDEDTFREQWARAKRDNASRLDFTRLKFNSWTEAESSWINPDKWDALKETFPAFDKSTPTFLAIDAGQTTDIFAVVALHCINQMVYVRSWGFVPEKALQREKQNAEHYARFQQDGSLKIVKGDAVGIEEDVYPLIDKLIQEHTIKALVIDKWQLLQLSQHYMKKNITVFEFPPLHSRFNEPCLMLERAISEGKIHHDGNALLRWNICNCVLDRDSKGYVKPSKKIVSQKIDNLVALVMAYSQVMQKDNTNSINLTNQRYEKQGIMVF